MRLGVWILCAGLAGLLAAAAGCDSLYTKKKVPPPNEYGVSSPYGAVRTLAIAPTVNLSGSRDFDPLSVSDSLFAELQQVAGLNVLPVNKTLYAMQKLGVRSIDTPATAQRLAAMLNADGLVVPAVTAYDPYNPPTLGMTLQLYTTRVLLARSNAEARRIDGTVIASPALDAAEEAQPVSQVSALFNARNQTVLRELRDFAAGRTDYSSALQDQKFLLDMDQYTRFVSHAMTRRLMDVERTRLSGR